MRVLMLVVAVVAMSCGPRQCYESCQGCCDTKGVCQDGKSFSACGSGGRGCVNCGASVSSCSPTGFCVR